MQIQDAHCDVVLPAMRYASGAADAAHRLDRVHNRYIHQVLKQQPDALCVTHMHTIDGDMDHVLPRIVKCHQLQ